MENASKALIIAGAILLSILLISLGVMVFQQGQDAIKNSGMSKAEIQTFNNQFTQYEGDKRGSQVKSLIQEVNASNASDKAEGNDRRIILYSSDSSLGLSVAADANAKDSYSTSKISSTSTFKVTIEDHDDSGFISKISIEPVKKNNKP